MISRVKICSEISDFVCFVSDVMEKSSSQYDSFLFWRQPIPALDLSELEDLGLIDRGAANSGKGREKKTLEVWSCDEEVRLKQVTRENVPLSTNSWILAKQPLPAADTDSKVDTRSWFNMN
uniref:Protein AF1q n=1 Tax=Oreochromis niloticus TaxID=8128 RepID=A0A669EQG8_ORENI